jgi:hypothetical protein
MEAQMSIDHYYTQIHGKWVSTNWRDTSFWVDISHGRNALADERYYFHDLASAIEFYVKGWRKRQYLDDDGNAVGLDHKGLYSRGRLVHGHSIDGDAPGHEGENLRQICEVLARTMNQEETIYE